MAASLSGMLLAVARDRGFCVAWVLPVNDDVSLLIMMHFIFY